MANERTSRMDASRMELAAAGELLKDSMEFEHGIKRKNESKLNQKLAWIGRELWRRKVDVIEEDDRRRFQDEERERRRNWRFRPRSMMMDKFAERLPPGHRKKWVDERAGPNEWVKGIIVEYNLEEGFKVVYTTQSLIGFDLEEILSPHEIERRLHEQTDLHWVQTELMCC